MKNFLLFLLIFSELTFSEVGVSFKKFTFEDTTGCTKIKYSFTFPVGLPNKAALPELQRNIIKFTLGEKYSNYKPEAAFKLFLKSDENKICDDGNEKKLFRTN